MEFKMELLKRVQALLIVLALQTIAAQCKSVGSAHTDSACSSTPTISLQSLYPYTSTLAVHPMVDTPYQDGSVIPVSPCPSRGTLTASDDLSITSTCPFEYATNYDRERIPAAIPEAMCLCGGCLDPYTGEESVDLVCQLVKYPMKVLRKSGCIRDYVKYDITTEDIAVGCACGQSL